MAQNNRKRTNNRKRRAPHPLPAPLPPSAPQQDNEVTAIFRDCGVSEINHRIRTEPVKCLIKGMCTIPKAEELLAAQKVALPIHLNLKKMIDDGQVLGEDLEKVYERMESYEGLIKRTKHLEESIPFWSCGSHAAVCWSPIAVSLLGRRCKSSILWMDPSTCRHTFRSTSGPTSSDGRLDNCDGIVHVCVTR